MTLSVLLIVLLAALLHATWNAVVKSAAHKLFMTIAVTTAAGLVAAIALPFSARVAAESWPFIAASTLCQVVYFILIARIYHVADMGHAYPLMRGTALLLVGVMSAIFVGDRLSTMAWAGIGLICLGIIGLTAVSRRRSSGGRGLTLVIAAIIAGATLIDGVGARRSGAPASYAMWIFLLTAIPLVGWAVVAQRVAFVPYFKRHIHLGAVGGIGTLASYGITLWAMTQAPVAIVAALRETSILFATGISALVLKEEVSRRRIAMAAVIAAGAVVLRLA